MSAKVNWLNQIKGSKVGTSFGVPWPKGTVSSSEKNFVIETEKGETAPLGTRVVSYWPDGSIKWTSHDWTGGIAVSDSYKVVPGASASRAESVSVEQSGSKTLVTNNVGLTVSFDLHEKQHIIGQITINGKVAASGAKIVAAINDAKDLDSVIDSVSIENRSFSRVLVKVSGHLVSSGLNVFPFDTRVYVYGDSKSIQVTHSFVYDLGGSDLLRSLGLKFTVPFENAELFNRHVRISGTDLGILREEVQGVTGLWKEITVEEKTLQSQGKSLDPAKLSTKFDGFLKYVPTWDTYTLSQLSSDGFEIKKRTKAGHSQVKVIGGTRSRGTAYIGSTEHTGLAVGLKDFWERYPTQIELTKLTKSEGEIIMWLYSPLAEPMEMSPYHDGLGKHSYKEQLEGLAITYEDWEDGFATPTGIARTFQLVIEPYDNKGQTPSNEELALVVQAVRAAPKLLADLVYLDKTGALGRYWSPDAKHRGVVPGPNEKKLEEKLDLLFNFYQQQIEQNRWYGFWDYGDVQHTYDAFRNAWRYDVGGFAWDNSELSTDLWLWLYFLHTGRKDAFKVAEAMTRHTGEVDVYHSGRFKRFGTRHGVQHFSDSAKQVRISNVFYRRIYYFLTTDERIGDLIDELTESELAIQSLDSHRKVLNNDHSTIPEGYAPANIGLDSAALLAAWLTAWERRKPGWESLRDKLVNLVDGFSSLKYGIATNEVLLNIKTGQVLKCKPPMPEYSISHLSMLFGFQEIISEVLEALEVDYPEVYDKLLQAYLKYSRAYNGTKEQQVKEYGFEFPAGATWHQSHSTNTADAAVYQKDKALALAAWDQFFNRDGYLFSDPLTVETVSPPQYFAKGVEAKWVTTNQVARFGVSALHNLARVGEYIEQV